VRTTGSREGSAQSWPPAARSSPVQSGEQILYADLDVDAARAQRRQFDPVGHYARPDVFHLTVDTQARRPVDFT